VIVVGRINKTTWNAMLSTPRLEILKAPVLGVVANSTGRYAPPLSPSWLYVPMRSRAREPGRAAGSFSRIDGTVEFYARVNALVDSSTAVLDFGAGVKPAQRTRCPTGASSGNCEER
jgi:hypothetical protein